MRAAVGSALAMWLCFNSPAVAASQTDITATIEVTNEPKSLIGSAVLQVSNTTGNAITIDGIQSRVSYLAPRRNLPSCLAAPAPDPSDTGPGEPMVVLLPGQTRRVGPRTSFDRNCIFPDRFGDLKLRAYVRWRYSSEPESATRTTTVLRNVELDP